MLINETNKQEILSTIEKLHQTAVDQRSTDLTDYLTDFFQSIQAEQSEIFRLLTDLLRKYDDRAALKIEFVQGQCLEAISGLLNTNEENVSSILQFLLELLTDSENVQEIFLQLDGYKKFFSYLQYIQSPSIDLLNQLILLMIDKSSLFHEDLATLPIDSFVIFINPYIAVALIYWIPNLTDVSYQLYIISSITKILLRTLGNKMMACSGGIAFALLQILDQNDFEKRILYDIFDLLEHLCQFSISSPEIQYICQLCVQNISLRKQFLQLLIVASKHNDPDTQSITSYFDLQQPNSGILLPVIRRWPSSSLSSSSQHFTFHCWLKLNHEVHSYPYEGHRQIYSIYSESIGLESFIRNSSLFVLVSDHRELAYIELHDCEDLFDNDWHSLTIVHAAQRPSLFVSAFQTTVNCHLTIYIDGLLRKEVKDFKFVTMNSDPIPSASIGSPSDRPKPSISKQKNESLSTTLAKTMQPLKGFFSSKGKGSIHRRDNQAYFSQSVNVIDPNSEDTIFGPSTCLYGQLACVWILADTLDENLVKHVHLMGADFCHERYASNFGDETSNPSSTIFDLFSTRSLLVYHPLACNGQVCTDISGCSPTMNGRLINSSYFRLHLFSQSLLNIGGCPTLYPLIELFQEIDSDNVFSSSDTDTTVQPPLHTSNPYSNPIASIIHLIDSTLSLTSMTMFTEQMIKHNSIEILADYLNHISPTLIDEELFDSIHQLIESSRAIDASRLLSLQLTQYILLDFHLWNKANHSVRLSHLQYLSKLIKDTKKFDRDKFGVQFFLDTLRQHFNLPRDDTDEEYQLRQIIYGIIKYLVQIQIRVKDFNALLSAIATISVSNDVITHELLNFILALVDSSSIITETITDILSGSNMIEGLYSLLVINNLASETKEIVIKIIKCFLESKQVSQQVRAQLRLETNHIGFGGIISGMALHELNQSLVQEILNLIISSNSSVAVHHLNVVLTLCSAASFDVRYIAMRKLMTYFITHPSACRVYAKCPGWQETLAHFFVKTRRPSLVHLLPTRSSSQEFLATDVEESPSLQVRPDHSKYRSASTPNFEVTISADEASQDTPDLDLTQTFVPKGKSSTNTKESVTDDSQYSNNTLMTPPISTSASREDLLSLLKRDNSKDKLNEMDRSSNIFSSNTSESSTTRLNDNEEGDGERRRIGSALRQFLGIKSVDESTFLVRSSGSASDGGILEEMCETLILAIVMILWKGISDSDDAAWTVCGQTFTALRHFHREYDLYLPLAYIERRILELSMETCLNDAKLDGIKQTPTYENNCRELIKLVNDFLSETTDNSERISDNLVKGILPILDTMLIFRKMNTGNHSTTGFHSSDEHWSETSLTGLNILLILLGHSNLSFCNQASIRIHSLLNCRPLNGREEAAYLLSSVNNIFSCISNPDESEYDAYICPLLKIILEKSFDLLQINALMPNSTLYRMALDDLRQCISSANHDNWQAFIRQITEPYADHYRSMSIRPFEMNMKIWWNDCHEMMNIAIHKRNRQIGVEKIKFQTYVIQPWQQRSLLEDQRVLQLNEQRRIHQIHVDHEWKNRKKSMYSERGPWWNSIQDTEERRWMLSDRENIHRMRCKLIENDSFNKHEISSRLRDNLKIEPSNHIDDSLRKDTGRKESLHSTSSDENEFFNISNETQSLIAEERERIIIGTKCSLITLTSTTDGEFLITDKYIYFFDLTRLKNCSNDLKYPLLWLQDIQLRRYHLRPTAMEFFLINQKNFLLNFDKNLSTLDKKLRRQIFQKLMSLKLPSMKSVFTSLVTTITPQEAFKESKITDKWITRELSNFDYLMMLNTIAGRTYNDLNQYPIFPWVIKDYTSQVLDLANPNVFRDFSKPIGIQNPKHIDEVKFKYESFDDPSGLIKKFHYGTHYSNAASVMHYLVRMEPFTTLHIQLQSGKFDIADRQFHSFQSSWTNIMDSPNDGKELIPEFFYLPELLSNSNQFDLGKFQLSDQHLNDVQLPPWAHHSPEEFIRLHRLALESDHVSDHLHEWIDLIFGYKQTGRAAVDALNVFMYCSYEQSVDADTIDDFVTRDAIDGMIQNFGQIPSQLLTEPHPQRQTRDQVASQNESQGKPLSIFQHLSGIKAFFVEITPTDENNPNPIVFISIPKNQTRSFMQQGTPDTLITVNSNGVVGNNGWHPYDKSSNNLFTFERDPTLQFERNRLTTTSPFSPSIEVTTRLFLLSHDGKFVFSGGHWDWSLCIYSLLKSKTVNTIVRHTDIITCLTLDSTGHILVTGSRDTTCVIWYLSLTSDQDTASSIAPEMTLYGHIAEVTCVGVSSELDIVVSGSLDGTCNIHTVEHGIYLRTLRPTGDTNDPIINLKLSDERHILIQTEAAETHLFLYSINGHLIRTRKFDYRILDMLLTDQYIIFAVNHSLSAEEQMESSSTPAMAKVIIKNMFELTTIQRILLRTHINCLYLTKDHSHLLVSGTDGKIFVLRPEKKLPNKAVTKP